MTLGELLRDRAKEFADYTALVLPEEEKLTYKRLNEKVNQLAHFLLEAGIEKGQKLGILLPNSFEFVISLFAIGKIGAISLPLNNMLTFEELTFILQDSETVGLITSEPFTETGKSLLARVDSLKFLWAVEKLKEECFTERIPSEPSVVSEDDEVVTLLYTSGTTGFPKGVMLTHSNLISNVKACLNRIKITPKDNFSCLLPLFHSFTLTTCILVPFYGGASSVIIKSLKNFKEVFRQILKSRVTVLIAVPSVYRILVEAKVPFLLTAFPFRLLNPIRLCVAGGEALAPEVFERFERKFHIPLLEGYGLTEASPVVSLLPPHIRKTGSVGPPLEGIEIKIVDENNRELPSGEVGEILVKGPSIMKGYYNRDEETKVTIRHGWLYTGDLGKLDNQGFLYIVDRKKDLIVVKGLNVYPKEVEDLLYTYPKVKEAAVVGKELADKEQIPVAYVVLEEGEEATEEEIRKFLRHSLASYKIPRRIEFRESLPKSPTGKILKKLLV
ncbi:MAG TPA: long-chain-fatty-acid--CoA ligase [Candidatus Omnitrophica bacterium]|nr:long-chain-fatty-acid--CoA ligase [Candidatus Omnitrophota bacterium]